MQENKIGFWGTSGKYGCFSNFYPCKFSFEGRQFNCTEQAFMWVKAVTFNDWDVAGKIIAESNPVTIKALGRMVKNYDDARWNSIRYDVMKAVNMAKYCSPFNTDIRKILMSTGNAYLFEDSPYDYIWGVGKTGTGQNLLGKVLMEIRKYLLSIGK